MLSSEYRASAWQSRKFSFDLRSIGRDRLLLAAFVALVSIVVVVFSIVRLTQSENATEEVISTGTASLLSGSSDPQVIMAPSNGHNGNAFALMAGEPMFPLPADQSLVRFIDSPIEMQGVKVQAVGAEGLGLWVGETETQRVYISVPPEVANMAGFSLNTLNAGDRLNFSGRIKSLPDEVAVVGVVDEANTVLLKTLGATVEANSVRIPAAT